MATQAQIDFVTSLYVGYFDRAPDPAGLQFWIDSIDAGVDVNTIAGNFAASGEAKAIYPFLATPGLVTPASFVGSIYLNLFNRPAEAAGLNYWVDLLNSGAISPADMIEEIIGGAQGSDQTILNNKVEAGRYFVEQAATTAGYTFDAADAKAAIDGVTADPASVTAAKAAVDAAVAGGTDGSTFTFTSTIGENLVGTADNDTFSGVVDGGITAGDTGTVNVGDTVDAAGGTDTLNLITVDGGGGSLPAGFTVSNMEIVNLTYSDGNDLGALASSSFGGVQQLWQIDNTNATDDFQNVTVGAGVTAGFRSTGNTATAATATATVTTAAGVTSTAIALDGVDTGSAITLGESTAAELSTVSVSGSVATPALGSTLALASTATDIDTLNLSISSNTTVTGIGAGNLDDLNTVNASGSTGNLTVNLQAPDELTSATFGSGNDMVTLDPVNLGAGSLSVNLGAGNDMLTLNAINGAPANALNITLGAGNDTLNIDTLTNITSITDIEGDLVTVADFSATQDVLDMSSIGTRDVLTNTELANISAAANLAAAAEIAAQATTGNYSIFDYAGDAYILDNNGAAGFDTGDGLVKIVGFQTDQIDGSNLVA